jgi:hypothetical protein
MTDQHRATPEQWAYMHERTEAGLEMTSCILELRARIEALEAAPQDKLDRLIAEDRATAMAELRAASAEARPAGGLVERVVIGILPGSVDGELTTAARAAIREVAAAAKDLRFTTAKALIDWLDREADRG